MVRSVFADASIEKYLENLFEKDEFSYGIIIGQAARQGKDSVIHLAKTTEYNPNDESPKEQSDVAVKNVRNINSELLVDHALSALRSIPGSFFILGIFVVSPKNVFDNSDDFKHLKSILQQLAEVMKTANNSSYGCSDEFDGGEKLIFHYAGKRSYTCKSINVYDLAKSGSGRPVDWKFQDKASQWQEFETIYDLDDTFNLKKSAEHVYDIEENFDVVLNTIQQKLNNSVIFLDGESATNPSNSVEQFIKQKNNRDKDASTFTIHGSIYYLCDEIGDYERVVRYNGTAKYSGIICSKIWVSSKQSIEDVDKFIKIDIMRSITGRLRMYTDAHHQSEQFTLVREPPRRVFFKLKSLPIMFSDYLFRGESDDTIITQAQANMDISLDKQSIVDDIETISDEVCYDEEITVDKIKQPNTLPEKKPNRVMYAVGIICAVGILLISIGVHVLLSSDDEVVE
ncbi:Protein odr-4 like [Pseudolycoriella hygida]|uniref:Protein odr-4 like n=1 Tax=Pseudolycoriella hygida TaxID=35572 RepID=A0A9Q0N3A1_9DIPT|nr:Protein odr-4 like [Pseudolycoriella hygida]